MSSFQQDFSEQNIFEERAERLSRHELQQWTALTELDRGVIEKLKGPGVKLLLGPRGSGKSTLMKLAYYDTLESEQILPIYINYSHSLALEPLFHTQANALRLFRQWVLLKIFVGVHETFKELKLAASDQVTGKALAARAAIRDLERGIVPDGFEVEASPSEMLEFLEALALSIGRSRCVLLMDDAAHAFSLEQQREFFEIFRQLRSRKVAGKAAIYPGITSFSHSFNVGHEAEIIEAWYDPAEEYYLPLMKEIVRKRLGDELVSRLGPSFDEYVSLLALAASGQPRGFLNMLSDVIGDSQTLKNVTRRKVLSAIDGYATYVDGVFLALADRLPRYKRFVAAGEEIKNELITIASDYNKGKPPEKRTQIVGLKEPLNAKFEKILQFFEYAGLARKIRSHSRGKIGVYQRYQIHSSVMYSGAGLGLGQSFTTSELIKSLSNFDAHEYCKISPSRLMKDVVEGLSLDLPPCSSCGTERSSAEQKFCMNCGSRLTEASLYEELLKKPIDILPIPRSKVDGILKNTKIRFIQDIMLDEDQMLLTVPRIGKIWSARIRNLAEEYVGV
ncbi:hypothetical protein [Xanthomonas sp. CFBP 7912]|uniref:hypothetical protein n=1 Tax=Xanthomonas sp. CFBP 7912 TaxID=1891621 RepID=UPI0011B08EB4|nr:hypothetical protein [Xanthomonas sp. CFBP 7912]